MANDLFAYKIAGVENGNPILDFGQVQVSLFTTPYLLQIFFTEVFPGEPQRLEPVWGMLATNPNPMDMPKISRIKYGELRAGYELRQSPEPLETGSYYAVGASSLILHKEDDNNFETIEREQFYKLPKPAVSKPVRFIESVVTQRNFAPGDDDDDLHSNPDYHIPSKKKASQRALELLQDNYFWSSGDEASPFGSDEGADLFNKYSRSATSLENPDGVEFLKAMCESWDLQPGSLADLQVAAADNPDDMDPAILAEAAAFHRSIPSVDSMDSQLAEIGLPPELLASGRLHR